MKDTLPEPTTAEEALDRIRLLSALIHAHRTEGQSVSELVAQRESLYFRVRHLGGSFRDADLAFTARFPL